MARRRPATDVPLGKTRSAVIPDASADMTVHIRVGFCDLAPGEAGEVFVEVGKEGD